MFPGRALPRSTASGLWGARGGVFPSAFALATASFALPPQLKLHGACEKYVLKLALQNKLPDDIVWRRKYGMSVPATDWALGPLSPLMEELLGPASLRRRGMFREDYVTRLRQGHDQADETRRRRIGEKLWALAMLEDGLMERFPFDEVHGLHNMPGLAIGRFETRAGPFMSAEDNFELVLRGVGGHAARPHSGNEVLVAACALVTSLQTIVSRRLSPADIAVVSVTELLTDGTRNALPGTARILGDARSFRPEVSAEIERQMGIIAQGTAQSYNLEAKLRYLQARLQLAAAVGLLGDDDIRQANDYLGPALALSD